MMQQNNHDAAHNLKPQREALGSSVGATKTLNRPNHTGTCSPARRNERRSHGDHIKQSRPFFVAENEEFQLLVKIPEPKYSIPSCCTLGTLSWQHFRGKRNPRQLKSIQTFKSEYSGGRSQKSLLRPENVIC